MPDLRIQAPWNEPVQAHQQFITTSLPWCKSMWAAGHRLVAEFRLHEDVKTDKQRAYYHGVVLKAIADQARPNGESYPMAVWKEFFRSEYLGHKTITTKNPMTGKKVRRRQRVSTEDLGVKGYSQLIDRVTAFASNELGVTIPDTFEQWAARNVDPDTGEVYQ